MESHDVQGNFFSSTRFYIKLILTAQFVRVYLITESEIETITFNAKNDSFV